MKINLFGIPPALTCLFLLLLGFFVFSRRKSSRGGLPLAAFCFSLSWWLFGYSLMYFSDDPIAGIFWARFGCMGIVLIPVFTLHFILELLDKHHPNLVKMFYWTAFLLLPLVWTPFVYQGIQVHFWGFYPKAGPLYWLLLSTFLVTFLTGAGFLLLELIHSKKFANQRHYNRIKFVFLGILVGCFGVVDYVIKYGINIYPFGYIAAFIFASSIVYAIFRHKLLDIDVIIRNTLLFAGLFGILILVAGVITAITQSYVGKLIGFNSTTSNILNVLVIMLLFDRTQKLLVNVTDKFLFQKKYDYHKLLKDASRGMSNIESLQHLLGLVVHFITMRMRVKNAAVLMREGSSDQYHLIYQRGFDKKFLTLTLYQNDPLIHYLESHKEAVDIERIKEQVEAASHQRDKSEKAYDYLAIRERMNQLQASCCVPSFLGRELRNILLLGEKKSGEYYSNEDLNLLYTLAQESSIAIENARLYDEALRKSHELEHINEQLEHSKTLLMTALQEAEGANKQLQDTQAQLIHEQKMATLGRLAASVGHEVNNPLTILSMNVSRVILKHRKHPDMKVTEILDVFDKMEKNIERIKAVVNTLTGLLKKSEKGKFEALSLKLILEETLPLVQFQTYLDNLSGTEVDFNVPGNVPLIRGDLERLQEVFLNLFINAYHAMAGKRHRKIGVQAEIDPRDPNMVAIHFRDNGSGMTEDVMKKVFNYGFTTKAPGKGSGLGLYMCKYIIELHGGTITVDSKLGEGTTFTLTLPIYSETPALKSVKPIAHS
ncbi:MAG: ATP-binding protein [Candidatus Omnitrophota bacterium]